MANLGMSACIRNHLLVFAAGQKAEPSHRHNDQARKVVMKSEEKTVAVSQAHDATSGDSDEGLQKIQRRLEEERKLAGVMHSVKDQDIRDLCERFLRDTRVLNDVRLCYFVNSRTYTTQ